MGVEKQLVDIALAPSLETKTVKACMYLPFRELDLIKSNKAYELKWKQPKQQNKQYSGS